MIVPEPKTRLVLASASPRRRELLKQIIKEFDISPSNIDETLSFFEDSQSYVLRISRSKAQAVFEDLRRATGLNSGRQQQTWVLAADTAVAIDGTILGKPGSVEEARRMLGTLQGRRHQVITGICLLDWKGEVRALESVVSDVWMRPLEDSDIEAYIHSGEPFDKAGAYAVQGLAGRFIERIDGSYSNVVGLPLEEVQTALVKNGILS